MKQILFDQLEKNKYKLIRVIWKGSANYIQSYFVSRNIIFYLLVSIYLLFYYITAYSVKHSICLMGWKLNDEMCHDKSITISSFLWSGGIKMLPIG